MDEMEDEGVAEVTRKRVGELQRGVFKILLDLPDGLPAYQIIEKMKAVVPPTDFEKLDYPNHPGSVRFDKMIRFATVACVKAGWLVKQKGSWYLTDEGKKAYSKYSSPEAFEHEARKLYYVWRSANKQECPDVPVEEDINHSTAAIDVESAEEQAWLDVKMRIESMEPYNVQNVLMPGLLRGMGYHVNWVAPPGADGGVDIVAYPDPLGTKEPTIKVSVRRRDGKADVKDLREFISRLHNNDVGIFFSVAGFTRDAERETRQDSRRIRLIDLERFFALWIEHYDGIPEESRKLLPVRPVWFLADSER
jgi:restriction system protein